MIQSKREKGKPSRMSFVRPDSGGSGGDMASRMKQMMQDPNAMDMVMERIVTNNMGDGVINGEDVWAELSEASAKELDIVGYNYFYKRYEQDRAKYPERIIYGGETHASNTYETHQAMMANPNVIGDFIWTAYDNLGEAGAGRVMLGIQDVMSGMLGPWPWISCYQGDLDLDGNRRPQSYYRKIMWGKDDGIHLFVKHPDLTGKKFYGLGWHWDDVCQSWTWDAKYIGKDIDVEAYADCDEVEFILNGKSLGKAPVDKLKARFTLPYQPGTVKAVAWKNGSATAENSLVTAGKPASIELAPDRKEISADGRDLCFVKVRLIDANGVTIPTNEVELSAVVAGGSLAGFGSGNPCTDEDYGTGKRRVWNGLALVCLRAADSEGDIKLKVSAAGLPDSRLIITCK